MTENLPKEMRGHWWVPGNRDASVVGTLTIDARGRAKLTTDEVISTSWLPASNADKNEWVSLPAIHGEVAAREITLLGCRVYAIFLGEGTIDVLCNMVVDGAWLRDSNERAFNRINVEVEHLAAWSGRSPLHATLPQSDSGGNAVPVVSFAEMDRKRAATGDMAIELRWSYSFSTDFTNVGGKIVVADSVAFEVVATDPTDIETLYSYAEALQNMILFAAGKYAAITSVRLVVDPAWVPVFLSDGPPIVTAHRRQRAEPDPIRIVSSSEMAFTLANVDFESFVPGWFDLSKRLRTVLDTLLGNYAAETQFLENKLASIVAAAEQAYRLTGGKETFVNDGKLKRIRRMIKDALNADSDIRECTAEILRKVDNRVTLDTRLRHLISEIGSAATVVFGDNDGVKRWVAAAKRSRNDIAHAGVTDRYDANALSVIEHAARTLVEVTLLKQLGIEPEVLVRCAQRRSGDLPTRIKRLPKATKECAQPRALP